MRNERIEAFDTALAELLGEVDASLEAQYGDRLRRLPSRPAAGETANPQYDGLFTVVANFTAGIGSKFGPGYALDLRVATPDPVSEKMREHWETFMVRTLRKRLPAVFPDRALAVDRDMHGWKLHGDLSLN